MLLKCAAVLLVILSVQSAILQGRNIPVGIRYKRLDHDITSNLTEQVQLSANDFKENQLRSKKLNVAEENLLVPETHHSNLLKKLDEKVQLFPEELLQSSKPIPIQPSIKESSDLHLDILCEGSESLPATPNEASLIQKAQEITENGLKHLKINFSPKGDEIAPSKELWQKIEKDVEEYVLEQKNSLGARQGTNQQKVLKNVANGFEQLTNNFIEQFQGQNQSNQPAASGDEKTAVAGAGTARWKYPTDILMDILSNRIEYIANSLQNLGQNIFQKPQQGINQSLSDNNTQGDTGTENPTGSQQQGFSSGAVSQINQTVSSIIPTSQVTPVVQENETIGTIGTTGVNQVGPIRQVFHQIGYIVSGSAFNPFKEAGKQNNVSQAPNQNFIQKIGQNIGNAFQNIQNQFKPPDVSTPQKPATGGDAASAASSNQIVGQVSNVGNQLQQVAGQVVRNNPIHNIIPGSSSGPTTKEPVGEQLTAPAMGEEASETKPEEVEKKEVMTATE